MRAVVNFLLTARPEEALPFYRDQLSLHFVRDDGFALVFDNLGVMLRISKVEGMTPAQHTVLGWESDDIASTVTDLEAKGITFERYPNMGLDAQGICTFPNGDKVAWFKDPDDNVLSISQHLPAPGI